MTVSLEYLAGIIDGEGSIMFVRTGNAKMNGMWASWTIKMIVANTNMKLLTALQESFGGKIWLVNRRDDGNWKDGYRLQWFGQDAADLLEKIAPYLIIKGEQASYALAALALRNSEGGKGKRKSEEAVIYLNEVADKIKALNKRGMAA